MAPGLYGLHRTATAGLQPSPELALIAGIAFCIIGALIMFATPTALFFQFLNGTDEEQPKTD